MDAGCAVMSLQSYFLINSGLPVLALAYSFRILSETCPRTSFIRPALRSTQPQPFFAWRRALTRTRRTPTASALLHAQAYERAQSGQACTQTKAPAASRPCHSHGFCADCRARVSPSDATQLGFVHFAPPIMISFPFSCMSATTFARSVHIPPSHASSHRRQPPTGAVLFFHSIGASAGS